MILNDLSPAHEHMLTVGSGIAADVITARGYRTVTVKADLKRLGFSDYQCIVPTLLVPVRDVRGELATYQHRPTTPRIQLRNGKARPIKYETRTGSRMCIDVPEIARASLGDPTVPLWITEGSKKADAAVSLQLCCVALLGVWNWRGANGFGGVTALADWEAIALKNRKVYIAFDSDVMEKREVRAALRRLKDFLESRDACVLLIYLPPGEGGAKVGLDDFFVAGGTVDALLRLASPHLPLLPGDNDQTYFERDGSTFMRKPLADHTVEVRLANFTARIALDITHDDGSGERHFYEIMGKVGEHVHTIRVQADRFASLTWVPELGATAIVEPGLSAREHLRAAIQKQSHPERVSVFAHTGWRKIDGEWHFLHAGGALGKNGNRDDIRTQLPGELSRAHLPQPPDGDRLKNQVIETLSVAWDIGPHHIMVPLVAAVVRAVLGEASLTLFLVGPTGVFKSELAALCQSFMGNYDSQHLPLSWSSTANALEDLLFVAKDMPIVVDDFVASSPRERERLMAKSERVIRAVGNHQGRQRMRADASLAPAKPPRGLVIATGEELPDGHSLRARCYVVSVERGDIQPEHLTKAQELASGGVFAGVMAAFIQELAHDLDAERKALRCESAMLRTKHGATHRRTSTQIAELTYAWNRLLMFAARIGAVSQDELHDLQRVGFEAIAGGAHEQEDAQGSAEPTNMFTELIRSCLQTGATHLASARNGSAPGEHTLWGWDANAWAGHGPRIGWVDNETTDDPDIYLDSKAAYAAAHRRGRDLGSPIPIGELALKRALNEHRLIEGVTREGRKTRYEVQKVIAGRRMRVLHFKASSLGLAKFDPGDSTPDPLTSGDTREVGHGTAG